MNLDPKALATLAAVVAAGAGLLGGKIIFTTPAEAECAVKLADRSARYEVQAEAIGECKKVLALCAGIAAKSPESP